MPGPFLVLLLAAAPSPQHPPAERFRIKVGSVITGTEGFDVARSARGTRITGTLHTERPGATIDGTEEETLAPDGSLMRYRLAVTVAGTAQTIEAWRDGDSVRMRAAAGGQSREQVVPVFARSAVLDNLVASHFQVLLDQLARDPAPAGEWRLYVPQALVSIAASVSGPSEDHGALDGRSVALRRWAVDAGGNLVNVWADAASNRLMRVAIPVQQVEMVREGFAPASDAGAPAAAAAAAFVERDMTVTNGLVALPGTLCLPRDASPAARVPLVVLVAGSGPNDRDETIGPNKPFADLARGLAAAGIASLRYDKRTLALRGRLDARTLTVDEEVIDDALAAIAQARTVAEVDPARVLLAGHSLGGTLAPLIAARAPAGALRGVILLAPGARPLDAVVEEQVAMRLRVAGQPEAEVARQVEALRAAFARVRSGAAPDSELVFFAPAHYWRDLFARRPLEALRALPLPVLVLQGGKDFQATKADYDLVAAALAPKPAPLRELRWFPDLNHLFMAVPGGRAAVSTGAEYGVPGHMDPAVIAAVAAWVRR